MAQRKPFLRGIDPEVLDALQRWAADELRSLNGQIELVLRRGLRAGGRHLPRRRAAPAPSPPPPAPPRPRAARAPRGRPPRLPPLNANARPPGPAGRAGFRPSAEGS